jgi:hypothetical protein
MNTPTLDEGLRQMIEHKTLSREMSHEFRGDRQMARIDQDVKGKIEFFQQTDPTQKVRLQKEAIVGFALHNMADPNQFGICRKLLQLLPHIWKPKINPSDDSKN